MVRFYVRCAVYLVTFAASWYAMSALQFEKALKANHVRQAQVLYVLCVMALAWLSGSFLLEFIYNF